MCGLQVLLEESARLKQVYPGANAEHIAEQQRLLAEGWRRLQDAALHRRDRLNAAYDLHRFLANVSFSFQFLTYKCKRQFVAITC